MRRLLSTTMCLILLCSSLPLWAAENENKAISGESNIATTVFKTNTVQKNGEQPKTALSVNDKEQKNSAGIYINDSQAVPSRTEITSMRTDNCRYFKNSDGTMTAEIQIGSDTSSKIDNTLKPSSDSQSWENKAGLFKAKFPKMPEKQILDFNIQNTRLGVELEGLDPANSKVEGRANEDTIRYTDILSNTDFEYKTLDNGVKESIILKSADVPDNITFNLNASGLKWKENSNGQIDFSSQDADTLLFYINPVSAIDASGKAITSIKQKLIESNNVLSLHIFWDKNELISASYPITIDPTITIAPAENEGMDTYIYSNYTGGPTPYQTDVIPVDMFNNRALIKFPLNSMPRGRVLHANLYLTATASLGQGIVAAAYQVNQEWLESEATWFNGKWGESWLPGGAYIDSGYCGLAYGQSINFDLTYLVACWNGGNIPNYGVLIKATSLSSPSFSFYSSNYTGIPSYRPRLVIDYDPYSETPCLSVAAPSNGATVSGNATVSFSSEGVKNIQVYAGDYLIGSNTSNQISWDTTKYPDGQYKLWAKGYDNGGRLHTSKGSTLADCFTDTSHVDQDNTTAVRYYNNITGKYGYSLSEPSNNTLMSITYTTGFTIRDVTLEVADQSSGSITFYVNSSGTWEQITPGTVTQLQHPGTHLWLKAIGHGVLYGYQIQVNAVDYVINVNNNSTISPPTALTAQSDASGNINLFWTASTTPEATYRIYRSETSGFSPVFENNFNRPSVAYTQAGTQVASGSPRYETAKFGQGIMIEEGTTNVFSTDRSQSFDSTWTSANLNGIYTISIGTGSGQLTATQSTITAFNSSTTWTCPQGVTNIEVLVVGGGGSGGTGTYSWGGRANGSGGGGGEVINSSNVAVTPGTVYTITVGQGGAAVTTSDTAGNDGQNSVAFGITARGGHKGSGYTGGASGNNHAGATGDASWYSGGGGGGDGGNAPAHPGGNTKSNGGPGTYVTAFSNYGDNGYFGGGGQGAGAQGVYDYALGGGGACKDGGNPLRKDGLANTGGGGGANYGGTGNGIGPSGAGGSGVVILKYPTNVGGNATCSVGGNTQISTSGSAITFTPSGGIPERCQLELKSYPTTWQDGANPTRAAETLAIPAADIVNSNVGSIEFWAKAPNSFNPDGNCLFASSNTTRFDCWYNHEGHVGLYDGTGWTTSTRTSASLQDQNFHCFMVTWDSSGQKLYIDGVLEGSTLRLVPSFGSSLYIGSDQSGSHQCNSIIDDLRISDEARTLADHQVAFASNEASPTDESTTYKLDFDGSIGGGGNVLPDFVVAGGINATSYHDTVNLLKGKTYYYKVAAVDKNGVEESSLSNEAYATSGLTTLAPMGLSAQPHTGWGIDLSWGASGIPGTTYKIYRSETSEFSPSDPQQSNFNRPSVAYTQAGVEVSAGLPRYENAKFNQGIMIEEEATNLFPSDQSKSFDSIWTSDTLNGIYTLSIGAGTGQLTSSHPSITAFNSSTTWTCPQGVTNIEVLVVGGGGSGGTGTYSWGGRANGSGGGGGEVINSSNVAVTPGTVYTITVGQGGAAVTTSDTAGNDGQNSVAFGITARGGHKGSGYTGGASGNNHAGATGDAIWYSGGGGGGDGGNAPAHPGGNTKSNGGPGTYVTAFSNYGDNGYFGGGGQGAGAQGVYDYALGGGGACKDGGNPLRKDGLANTGGGGGANYGGTGNGIGPSGAGGSGVVLINIPGSDATYNAGTSTQITVPNATVTFTATGGTPQKCQLEQSAYPTSWQDGATPRTAETLIIPTDGVLQTSAGSIEFWAKAPESFNVEGNCLFASSNTTRFDCWYNHEGHVGLYDGTGWTTSTRTSASLQDQNFHCFMVTWDSSGQKLYIDGVLEGSTTRLVPSSFGSSLYIGSDQSGSHQCNSILDDLRISDEARTLAEHQAVFVGNQASPSDESTTLKLNFDRSMGGGTSSSSCNLLAEGITDTYYYDNADLEPGRTYYYRVSSVGYDGVESELSNEAGAVNDGSGTGNDTSDRIGVKSFWDYASFPLARGDGMVNLGSGNLAAVYTDSLLPGIHMGNEVRRTYNSLDKNSGLFGYGWSGNILASLTVNRECKINCASALSKDKMKRKGRNTYGEKEAGFSSRD